MSVATILTCGFLFLGGILLTLALDFYNFLFWIGFALIFMGLIPLVHHWWQGLRHILSSEESTRDKEDSHGKS